MSRLIRICIALTIWCLGSIAYGEESRPEVIVPADRLEDQPSLRWFVPGLLASTYR